MKKEKIKIGLFIDVFYPMIDGVVMVVDNYAKRLAKYADVVVFAPRYIGQDYDDSKFNYKVVRCMSIKVPFIDYSLPAPKLDQNFKNVLQNSNLDIVHIHSPFTIGKAGIRYAKHHKIPCIATMHSQYKQDFARATRNKLLTDLLTNKIIKVYNQCDECWAVNSEVGRIFYEDYGYKKMPIIMNNATEMLPLSNYKEACQKINEMYKLADEKVFVFVGRINTLKNVFFIMDALKIIRNKYPEFKFKMFFIGNGQDEEQLKKTIIKYHMEDCVIMCGRITDRTLLASYYARSDLFLFPSLYDASSIVQIEAASQKTPALFLKGASTAATIIDNINGFIEENDVEKYAERIMAIMNDNKLLYKVSQNAYRDLYKNWDMTIDEVYNKYIDLIRK